MSTPSWACARPGYCQTCEDVCYHPNVPFWHLPPDERHAISWAHCKVKLAWLEHTRNHPRQLSALYLLHARGSRRAAAEDHHPGRHWWLRQARIALVKAREQRR